MDDCNGGPSSLGRASTDFADLGLSDPRAYRRLAAAAREQISSGKLTQGQPLPSITALSRDHGCARQTCSKAYRTLEDEGLLRRFPGLGYFVLLRREIAFSWAASDPLLPTDSAKAVSLNVVLYHADGMPWFDVRL